MRELLRANLPRPIREILPSSENPPLRLDPQNSGHREALPATRRQPAECSKRAYRFHRAIAAVLARELFRWLELAKRFVRLIPALSGWPPDRCFAAPYTHVDRKHLHP